MVDDAELLRSYARDRSQEAFTELVRRCLNLVYFAALRRTDGDTQLAEDVTQSVFIDLANGAKALSHHAALTGWLYTATRNRAINAIQSEKRRRTREQEYHKMHKNSSAAAQSPDWEQLRPVLDEVMDQLGNRDRQAVLLRFFDGRAYAEIGQILRLNEDAARKRVERALDSLRAVFARRGIISTSAALAELLSSQAAMAAPAELMTTVVNATVAAAGTIGTGGAATAGIFAFMSATKSMVGVASVIAILSLGVAVYELRAVRAEQATAAALSRQQTAETRQLRQLELAGQPAGLPIESALARPTADRAVPGREVKAAAEARRLAARAKAKAFLNQSPQARNMLVTSTIRTMENYYAPFFRSAGLSQAQIDEFLARTAQLDINSLQINPDGTWHFDWDNLPADDARSILGDAAYQQLQEANRVLPAQFWSMNLGAVISSFATPLSSQQISAITQIVAANNPDYAAGNNVNPQSIDPDAIMEQAKALMTNSQWKRRRAGSRFKNSGGKCKPCKQEHHDFTPVLPDRLGKRGHRPPFHRFGRLGLPPASKPPSGSV